MSNTFNLSDENVEFLTNTLTMFAQISRAMRRGEQAERLEELRNEIYSQYYSGS